MGRNTSIYTKLADPNFDDRQQLAKLKRITPTEVYKYTVIPAMYSKQYESFAQIIKAQMKDPLAGLAIGDKPPGTRGLNHENKGNQTSDQEEGCVYKL